MSINKIRQVNITSQNLLEILSGRSIINTIPKTARVLRVKTNHDFPECIEIIIIDDSFDHLDMNEDIPD